MSPQRAANYACRFIRQAVLLPVTLISCFVPKDRSLWVFGAWHGEKYSDNAKYLFQYILTHKQGQVRAVWITKSKGDQIGNDARHAKKVYAYSLEGFLLCMRASVAFVTHSIEDVNEMAFARGLLVNLTHGTPLKRLERDSRSSRFGPWTKYIDAILYALLPAKRKPDLICVASSVAVPRFASAFGIPPSRVLATGYPRFEGIRVHEQFVPEHLQNTLKGYKRVILYAPTHRGEGRRPLSLAEYGYSSDMHDWMRATNSVLIVKPHKALQMKTEMKQAERDNHIVVIDDASLEDINALLPLVNILITDYSSIMFDYALLRRPMIFLAPDLEAYTTQDVGIYGTYDVPGPVVRTWAEAIAAIREVEAGEYKDAIREFADSHAEFADGAECERIISAVRQRL
jgi:CDP-glycerol glycerophosphotransferase (TagB/SpsB family)